MTPLLTVTEEVIFDVAVAEPMFITPKEVEALFPGSIFLLLLSSALEGLSQVPRILENHQS